MPNLGRLSSGNSSIISRRNALSLKQFASPPLNFGDQLAMQQQHNQTRVRCRRRGACGIRRAAASVLDPGDIRLPVERPLVFGISASRHEARRLQCRVMPISLTRMAQLWRVAPVIIIRARIMSVAIINSYNPGEIPALKSHNRPSRPEK